MSETWKKRLKTLKEGINHIIVNTIVRTDGQTWRKLTRIKIVSFENLLAQQFQENA